MTEDVVTLGLRTIGCIRDQGRTFAAWSEPTQESLGQFNTYATAARAIYENDIKEREQTPGVVGKLTAARRGE